MDLFGDKSKLIKLTFFKNIRFVKKQTKYLKSSISASLSLCRPTRKLEDPATLPDAARLPEPVLLAVDERLLCRVYDWDLLEGMAIGMLMMMKSFWLCWLLTFTRRFVAALKRFAGFFLF